MADPWLKFYPADWRSDPLLRMCSLAARGLWMELLALMHEAQPRGHLRVNGKAVSIEKLSILVGSDTSVQPLLDELESVGVFSRKKNGVIFSRRMERDEQKARKNRESGKLGGNPSLRKHSEILLSVNPPDKAKRPEVRNKNNRVVEYTVAPDRLEQQLRRAAGLENAISPNLFVVGPILELIKHGVDLETDILPVIKAKAATMPSPAVSWAYFVKAIQEAHQRRIEAGQGVAKVATPETDDRSWNGRLEVARNRQLWSTPKWGPMPGRTGCIVPPQLLIETDGIGWKEDPASSAD